MFPLFWLIWFVCIYIVSNQSDQWWIVRDDNRCCSKNGEMCRPHMLCNFCICQRTFCFRLLVYTCDTNNSRSLHYVRMMGTNINLWRKQTLDNSHRKSIIPLQFGLVCINWTKNKHKCLVPCHAQEKQLKADRTLGAHNKNKEIVVE